MTTTERSMAAQMDAAERLERAERALQEARCWAATATLDAPLAMKARDTERVRRAVAEVEAARAAYEAAQDIECPEMPVIGCPEHGLYTSL